MAGVDDPIKLSFDNIGKLQTALKDVEKLEYELNKMLEAGLDVEDRAKATLDMRRKIEGMLKVYGGENGIVV